MLKGIVVYGTKRPPLHDKAALIEAGLRWRKTLQQYSSKTATLPATRAISKRCLTTTCRAR